RALQVVCVAADGPSLQTLKRATVSQHWELTPGATGLDEALEQIADRRAHVLVVWGDFPGLVKTARERVASLRIVAVGHDEIPEADVNVPSVDDVRDAIVGAPPAGGPVRAGAPLVTPLAPC